MTRSHTDAHGHRLTQIEGLKERGMSMYGSDEELEDMKYELAADQAQGDKEKRNERGDKKCQK
jgi:hypothetical protein